mgnify:CR=1 FL=1
MAKYTITYACGHQETIQLYGKSSDREWKMQSMQQRLCPACYKAAKKQEQKEAGERAGEVNKSKGCVALEGSEAQIAWAEAIRLPRITALMLMLDRVQDQANRKEPTALKVYPVLVAVMDWAKSIDSAKWWIDNRSDGIEVSEMQSFSLALSYISGAKTSFAVTDAQLVKQMLVLAPHTTEEVAHMAGIRDQWGKRLEKDAAKQQEKIKAERLQTAESARDFARGLGIKGRVAVWTSSCGDHQRVYADQFTYNHTGKNAGHLENKTDGVADDHLRDYCERLCKAWKKVSFYA